MNYTISRAKSKILIIDDDPTVTELFQVLLTSQGHDVIVTQSGKKGVEIACENLPDVIILDLLMPGMNGWQVCAEIRKFSNVPIIIISVVTSPEAIADILNLGADEYLVKPVSGKMLTAAIENLVRRANTEKIMRPLADST